MVWNLFNRAANFFFLVNRATPLKSFRIANKVNKWSEFCAAARGARRDDGCGEVTVVATAVTVVTPQR
jgi:hypothetical protein